MPVKVDVQGDEWFVLRMVSDRIPTETQVAAILKLSWFIDG